MGRCTDRRDMTKAVEIGVKLQTNKLIVLKLWNLHSTINVGLKKYGLPVKVLTSCLCYETIQVSL